MPLPRLADILFFNQPLPSSLPAHLTSYHRGKTPLSTTPEVAIALVGYLVTIFSVRHYQTHRPAAKLNALFQAHNFILTTGSALLLALMVEEIGPIVWKHGLFYAICDEGAWTPRMEFYYMINYYIKYVELIDTLFLALKKKPLAFLHVFHHAATALLCYTQLNGKTSVSWVVITLNLLVHVFMYYYYYATAGGRTIWWKKYLTSMQITQFIIDLFTVYYASSYLFMHRHLGWSEHNCAGSEGAALFGCALLTSYLGLFVEFFIKTYGSGAKKARAAKAAAKANGHANGNGVANGKKD